MKYRGFVPLEDGSAFDLAQNIINIPWERPHGEIISGAMLGIIGNLIGVE